MPTRSVPARVCQALMILWGWLSANAAEPPTTPILRIETGMHTAAIRRLATDAANRYLVTGSDDKTVRVWELATGRLARVLRPPIGPGNEGKVYVVALSPDATTVACGGWAGAWEGAHCIYLFDRASGRLLRRITGLPEVVLHLVYSPDGRFLAATLGEGGVRKWRVPDYDLAGEDRDYGARSYGASFDRAGRLATTCYDGFIRLYDARLKLLVRKKALGASQPYAVSFSPDGARLAIGFADAPKVAVLSAEDLSPLYAPDTAGMEGGNLGCVAWSADALELRVPIPERDCEISLIAENKHAASVPANVRVHWHGRMAEFVIQPKLYVLAVGVGQYEDASLRLEFAAKDARDFAEAMRRQQGGLYRHVECKLLADAQAAKGDILDGLEWIQRQTTSKDVAAIFLAGHGINDDSGFYYFAPVDFQRERVKRTAVPWSEVKGTVESLAGKVLFFVDTCHAGAVMGPKRRGAADFTRIINELASAESGAVVFAASTGRQASLEDPAWNNGAFTRAVVEGLEGKADYHRSGRITINMLDLYISERVKELTQGRQTPTTTKPQTIPDFPVALTR